MRSRCNKCVTFFNAATHSQCQGRKIVLVFLTQKSIDKYTKNVRMCIRNVSHARFRVPIFQEVNYVVKRLDEAPAMCFLGVLSMMFKSRTLPNRLGIASGVS